MAAYGRTRPTPAILVIEDSPVVAMALLEALSLLWPAAVEQAMHCADLGSTRLWLARHLPDLVIADLKLPDSEPDTTITTLVQLLPAHVPLVVISGYVTSLEGYQYLERGADAFLPKGGDTLHMVEAIGHVWLAAQGRRQRQRLAVSPTPLLVDEDT